MIINLKKKAIEKALIPSICTNSLFFILLSASMELLSLKKTMLAREHRQACYAAIEKTFGEDPSKDGDLIVINYFALVLIVYIISSLC